MVEKTAKPSVQKDNIQTGQDSARPITPLGAKMGQPGNLPDQKARDSRGFDPVGDAGREDGQKGRPEHGVSPDQGGKGKPFQDRPDQAK